ncbi:MULTISPECIES: TrbC/VirB2 family protein [Fusobacterium]|uniref:TrbC/VirB2 family protein n=1 Tax=Fusobacterium TaxID=848 RepID=UPI001239C37C|nr:TrbC/VirB2 family protein [Fusobacterium nucleatum]
MRKIKKMVLGIITLLSLSINSFATGAGGMVWEKPATSISKSISGPVAGVIALVSIVVACLAWAMTDGGNMMGKAIRIVVALAVVGSATLFLSTVFGINTSGGMMI